MNSNAENTPPKRRPPAEQKPVDLPRLIQSDELLQGHVEVLIEHDGEVYRLRRTRQGKLILNK